MNSSLNKSPCHQYLLARILELSVIDLWVELFNIFSEILFFAKIANIRYKTHLNIVILEF